jgi:hypothetical protein
MLQLNETMEMLFCSFCYKIECEHQADRLKFKCYFKKRTNQPVVALLTDSEYTVYRHIVEKRLNKENDTLPNLNPIIENFEEDHVLDSGISIYSLNQKRVLILYYVFSDIFGCGLCCKFFSFGNESFGTVSESFLNHYRYCAKRNELQAPQISRSDIERCFAKFYGNKIPPYWGAALTQTIVESLGIEAFVEDEDKFCSCCLRSNNINCHSPATRIKMKAVRGNRGGNSIKAPVLNENDYATWIIYSAEYHEKRKSVPAQHHSSPSPIEFQTNHSANQTSQNAASTNSNPAPLNVFQ